jgi:hypothetical protein
MHILEHPELGSIESDALQCRIDGMARWNVGYADVPEAGMTGFELSYQTIQLFLKFFGLLAREDLGPSTFRQCRPINPVHPRVAVLDFHQAKNLVDNSRPFFESKVHGSVILMGAEASPIATNPAQ